MTHFQGLMLHFTFHSCQALRVKHLAIGSNYLYFFLCLYRYLLLVDMSLCHIHPIATLCSSLPVRSHFYHCLSEYLPTCTQTQNSHTHILSIFPAMHFRSVFPFAQTPTLAHTHTHTHTPKSFVCCLQLILCGLSRPPDANSADGSSGRCGNQKAPRCRRGAGQEQHSGRGHWQTVHH